LKKGGKGKESKEDDEDKKEAKSGKKAAKLAKVAKKDVVKVNCPDATSVGNSKPGSDYEVNAPKPTLAKKKDGSSSSSDSTKSDNKKAVKMDKESATVNVPDQNLPKPNADIPIKKLDKKSASS